MFDQVVIGNKSSLDDFEASMKERILTDGKKKSIKDTVPFSNKVYDFTKINGEAYWEEKNLEYIFEIVANTPEELEEKVKCFKTWIMNVHEEKLYDPYIEKYHFVATFDDIEVDETEIEKATIKVKFTAYPYMISNKKKMYQVNVAAGETTNVTIHNGSSHRIVPSFNSNVPFNLIIGETAYGFPAGQRTKDGIWFESGYNHFYVYGSGDTDGTVSIEFYEEVF